MFNRLNHAPNGWLAFELNVLRRLNFASVMMPFTNQPHLGAYLKRWNVRVSANDAMQSAWTKAVAAIQNNAEILSADEIEIVLEDAYVPRYRLQNAVLREWFNETDSWWFDNVRQNIERLSSPVARAVALSLGMRVGDYAASFTEETRELRQPFSKVYQRLWSVLPKPFNNGQNNTCHNKPANEFIAENFADLMFLRLPSMPRRNHSSRPDSMVWSEEWIRGSSEFWDDLKTVGAGKFGVSVETKSQYLQLLEEILQSASNTPTWAIAHVEDGFVTTQELIETVGRIRRVDTIYSKDFSELTGTKAVIITA
ncbi:MAG: hypothetical protein LH472_03665 [Pyrinomonadaceae bacterium]|nr:hypothetical protein [Pyrinomonadaceae bacterium]